MIVLDFIVRISLLISFIYMVKQTIKDIKSGELKEFFEDLFNNED